jgi:Protein of unknown function (DUF790)
VGSPLEPAALHQRVFAVSAPSVPSPQQSLATLKAVADALSRELARDIGPEQVRAWLYADLPAAHVLTRFEAPTPEVLLARYNLAQAQGVLYRDSQVVLTAHRNDPGAYKLLFRYLKLFGLMAYVEGDADHGFILTIDGPASLFMASPRYGLALAELLPALLHVTRWRLTAALVPRQGVRPPPGHSLHRGGGPRVGLALSRGAAVRQHSEASLRGTPGPDADTLAAGAGGGPRPTARQCHGARLSPGASRRPQLLARIRGLLAPRISLGEICPGAPGGAG